MSSLAQSVQVRLGRLEERAALEAIQLRASLANPQVIELPETRIANERVLVAEYEGCRAGFAVLLAASSGMAELDGLFVEPHLWRRGIGARLLEACKGKALSEGASCIAVVANTHARKFYSARGFVSTGTVKTQFSEAHRMTLILGAAAT